MTDHSSLTLLDSFIASHTRMIQNTAVLTDIDLSELFEADIHIMDTLIESNQEKFQPDSLLILTKEETKLFNGARFAFTNPGVFTLAGLIKTKMAIRIYVRLIELLVNKLQGRAYEIATAHQDKNV